VDEFGDAENDGVGSEEKSAVAASGCFLNSRHESSQVREHDYSPNIPGIARSSMATTQSDGATWRQRRMAMQSAAEIWQKMRFGVVSKTCRRTCARLCHAAGGELEQIPVSA